MCSVDSGSKETSSVRGFSSTEFQGQFKSKNNSSDHCNSWAFDYGGRSIKYLKEIAPRPQRSTHFRADEGNRHTPSAKTPCKPDHRQPFILVFIELLSLSLLLPCSLMDSKYSCRLRDISSSLFLLPNAFTKPSSQIKVKIVF